MSHDLDWSDAIDYFGEDLQAHRNALSNPGWSTYGLLACRFLPSDSALLESGQGEHAEEKLLRSKLWTSDLSAALSQWVPGSQPMLILLAINRSPCGNCAQLLAAALNDLNNRYPLRTPQQHFVLASLGYYHSNKDEVRSAGAHPRSVTTFNGLRALRDAGWKLCTLSFDGESTRRGKELNRYIAQQGRHA